LRGILKTKKIGHGGTLDPQVTGVLPIAIGSATRLLEYMEAAGKVYEGEITLGFSTETEDAYGALVAQTTLDDRQLSEAEIDRVMTCFVGQIKQVPPMYSAVKVKGKRLYEYARAGQIIERPARYVTVKEFVRTSPLIFDEETFAPLKVAKFTFRVACSKGTYIRTLAVDLAKKLGYEGHMSKLDRTAANGLVIDKALTLAEIEQARDEGRLTSCFYPLAYAVSDLTRLTISQEQFDRLKVGQFFETSEFEENLMQQAETFAVFF
jgi:tRNA pseudouridine55 synthase